MTVLAGWHVEGYGVLAGYEVSGLGPGLSVVAGPNEAGKSTLLDFLRGVLFGFPDRRSRLPAHEPLRGGRHGGSVELLDAAGGLWSLSRYAGTRAPVLVAPGGGLAGEAELAALLGGADAELFRSIFAFGLDELASFAALDTDAVRDAVFSAGVLGAGRSAAAAARALRQRREGLARPRQPDAPANRLLAELSSLEEELRAARREAGSHAARRAERERLATAVAEARERGDELRRHLVELDRLGACWPVQVRADAAREELARLGPPGRRRIALLAAEPRLERLAAERSGHAERLRRLSQLASQLGGIERERSQLLARLCAAPDGRGGDPAGPASGPEAPARHKAAAPAGVAALGDAEALLGAHRAATATLDAAHAEWERDAAELAELEQAPAAGAGGARALAELDEAEVALGALRAEAAELDRMSAERAAAEQARHLAELTAAGPRAATSAALALLAALAAGLAALAVERGVAQRALDAAVAAAAAAALLAAVAVLVRSERRRRSRAAGDLSVADGVRLASCTRRVGELAARLGLDARPAPGDLASCAGHLVLERNRRARLDLHEQQLARARASEGSARRRLEERRRAAKELAARAGELAASCGLDRLLGPEGLVAALRSLVELGDLDAARRRVLAPLAELEAATAAHEAEVSELVDSLPDPGGPRPASSDDALAALVAELHRAVEQRELAAKAARTLEECEEELQRQLGSTGAGALLRERLASGAVLDWEEQRDRLAVALEQASTAHESAVAAHRDAERALGELERSGGVADLELRWSARATELDRTLEEWAVLGLAESLLASTLARYERERQPAVVARAAELFRGVTGGRYAGLLPRTGDDGRGPGIDALGVAGERVDCASLSRGTAEQLYLCLRLAYAATFAERAAALPLVLDDVLVNFDPQRAQAVAVAVAEVADRHQVLAFTCHPHVVELLLGAAPAALVVELPERGR